MSYSALVEMMKQGYTLTDLRDLVTGDIQARLDEMIEIANVLSQYNIELPEPYQSYLAFDIYKVIAEKIMLHILDGLPERPIH